MAAEIQALEQDWKRFDINGYATGREGVQGAGHRVPTASLICVTNFLLGSRRHIQAL